MPYIIFILYNNILYIVVIIIVISSPRLKNNIYLPGLYSESDSKRIKKK